ncbi:MAG: T9SS type A sorting domain-containing protein, partial [Prevotella sp.]|nr:T9SS type A sorting domain-containing protein [Prevotella sp.]
PKKVKILPKDNGKVQISFDEVPTTPCWVHVYQTSGAKVRSVKLPSHQDTVLLDIQDLPQGVYVIQVNGQTQETTGSTLVRR